MKKNLNKTSAKKKKLSETNQVLKLNPIVLMQQQQTYIRQTEYTLRWHNW